ncbi:hypothetical protein AGMMS49546_04790 [Spirochaetia bacterium]|nr:hypothetical protein AGMMS49546_04790 [Spirochaetia bacterium]
MKKMLAAAILFFSTVLCFSQYNDNWLYVGARLGGAPNFYTAEGAYKSYQANFASSLGFNGAAQAAVQINELFAIQAELIYTHDETITNNSGLEEKFESDSLLIPVLAKMTYNRGKMYIAGLLGLYVSAPAGDMKKTVTSNGNTLSYSDTYSSPLGFMAGVSLGYKMGPGIVFADLRWAGDISKTRYNDRGNAADLYSRGKMPITLGYEIGLISKK